MIAEPKLHSSPDVLFAECFHSGSHAKGRMIHLYTDSLLCLTCCFRVTTKTSFFDRFSRCFSKTRCPMSMKPMTHVVYRLVLVDHLSFH